MDVGERRHVEAGVEASRRVTRRRVTVLAVLAVTLRGAGRRPPISSATRWTGNAVAATSASSDRRLSAPSLNARCHDAVLLVSGGYAPISTLRVRRLLVLGLRVRLPTATTAHRLGRNLDVDAQLGQQVRRQLRGPVDDAHDVPAAPFGVVGGVRVGQANRSRCSTDDDASMRSRGRGDRVAGQPSRGAPSGSVVSRGRRGSGRPRRWKMASRRSAGRGVGDRPGLPPMTTGEKGRCANKGDGFLLRAPR